MTGKKQGDLPGMDDREIKELEDKATEYAETRDKRIALSQSEGRLKAELLGLMKKHKKDEYMHEGIEIWIVKEEETVKVKVAAKDEEEATGAAA